MGQETSKARARRLREGYFERRFVGAGIDVGCGTDPVTPECVHWDKPQGDAQELPGVEAASLDWVCSSHCLEDLPDPRRALARWWEVPRPGGTLLVVVPDEDLYEQGQWPSRFNGDHRWTFTVHKSRSWSPVSLNLIAETDRHFDPQMTQMGADEGPTGDPRAGGSARQPRAWRSSGAGQRKMRQGSDPRSENAIEEVNAMSNIIRAHFDGKVLVPDEPLDLPVDEPLELELRAVGHERAARLREMIARFAARPLPGPALPAEAFQRENMYD